MRARLGVGPVGAQGDGERVREDVSIYFLLRGRRGYVEGEGLGVCRGLNEAIEGVGGRCGGHGEAGGREEDEESRCGEESAS